MMEPHFTTVFCAMFLTNLILLHSLSICQSVLSAGMPKSVEIIPFFMKLLHAWKLCNYLVCFFFIYTFNNILFLKIQKIQLLLHLKMNNDLNFDFILLQEAKGAWCFVYNHRSSTGNTNPRQRRIFTSQVSHKCARTHLVITFNCRIIKSAVILCILSSQSLSTKTKKQRRGIKRKGDQWRMMTFSLFHQILIHVLYVNRIMSSIIILIFGMW